MQAFVRYALLIPAIATFVGGVLVLALVPDEIMIRAAAARWEGNDIYAVLLPKELAKAKLKLTGFKSCELSELGPPHPVASFLVAAYTEPNADRAFLRSLFDQAIEQGCGINTYHQKTGLTPLHEAILFNDLELVNFLLTKSADPYLVIKRPRTSLDGKNAIEMIDALEQKSPQVKRGEVKNRLIAITTATSGGAR